MKKIVRYFSAIFQKKKKKIEMKILDSDFFYLNIKEKKKKTTKKENRKEYQSLNIL